MDTLTDLRFTPEESDFAERLIFYWTNFAKYGDPNGRGTSQVIDTEARKRFLAKKTKSTV